MATKQQWIQYIEALEQYIKELKKWVKKQQEGEVETQDASGGDRPPTPPPIP